MKILKISGLSKEYPKFSLQDVSFSMHSGRIMGFIGRNGAGKTTTLKAILNIIHPSGGEIECFGLDMNKHEDEIKQRIGFAGGAVDYYKKKKISDIIAVTKKFYDNWDEKEYQKYMKIFELDEDKTPSELSQGMKVKLSLVLALSHRAELLILDEPTSGLDPVSRDELLEIFKYLKNQGVSVLFSTHITSDLDKCADDITYIKDGKIIYTGNKEEFVRISSEKNIGSNLEEIMLYYEKEALYEKFAE